MSIVMVGGHTRNIGKTSVIEGIISQSPELGWTAIKVTQYGHGVCSAYGESCACQTADHKFAITPELVDDSGTDTSRFLKAGAKRSLWVRTKQGELFSAVASIKEEIEGDENVIVESNSLRRFIKPTVYLQVVHAQREDFKQSAQQYFDLADAYVVVSETGVSDLETSDNSSVRLLAHAVQKHKPVFKLSEERQISEDLMAFLRARLRS